MKKRSRLEPVYIPYLFISPCFILTLLILIYPVANGIFKSFYNENLIVLQLTEFVGLKNYADLLSDSFFINSLGRSIVLTIIVLAGEMIIGMFFATLLNSGIRAQKFLRCLVLIPWVIPNAIGAIIWRWFLNESYGMFNYLLVSFGAIRRSLPWLSDPKLAQVSLLVVTCWKIIPFVTVTLLAGLQSIPVNLYEAAKVDGANTMACFRYVTVPMVKNIVIITGILTSIWNFNQLEVVQVMTRGGPGESTTILPMYIFRLFMQSFQTSYASAAAVAMMLVMSVPTIFYVRKLLQE